MSDLSRKLALWAANNPRSEVAPLVLAASESLATPVSDDDLMRLLLDRPQCCARLRDAAYKRIRELETERN
jgi:hypothetical protein